MSRPGRAEQGGAESPGDSGGSSAGSGERFARRQVFPDLQNKTSNRPIPTQGFGTYAGIWDLRRCGCQSLFPLANCGAWDRSLHLSEPNYPAPRATGGLKELVYLRHFSKSLEHSRCSVNASGGMSVPRGGRNESQLSPSSFQATAL